MTVGVMPPIKYWEIVADKQLRLLRDKCAAFCQHDSNARESQGGAELIGISVERLHDAAIPNIAYPAVVFRVGRKRFE